MKSTNRANPLMAALTLAIAAHAQTSRGTVTGTVLDPAGAVIDGAAVTLTGVDTGVRLSTGSNEAGVYRFDAVDLGVYNLQVTHPGFRTYLGTAINVEANRVTTFDPHLEVGAAETRIEVSGEASDVLIKDSPLRGGNFDPREARNLPLISLNPLSLTRTLPGTTEAAGSRVWGGGTATGANNGGGFSINGQRPRGITTCWTGPRTTTSRLPQRNRCSPSPTRWRKFRFRPATLASSSDAPAAACLTW